MSKLEHGSKAKFVWLKSEVLGSIHSVSYIQLGKKRFAMNGAVSPLIKGRLILDFYNRLLALKRTTDLCELITERTFPTIALDSVPICVLIRGFTVHACCIIVHIACLQFKIFG